METTEYIPKNAKDAQLKGSSRPGFFFQPRLTINAPNDAYEQEADATADKMISMAVPVSENPSFHQAKASLQPKSASREEDDKLIRRKENPGNEIPENSEIDHYISSLSSSGQPMPEASRHFFEPRFGQDFSNVRIHNDSVAAKSAQSINALAYTSGSDIVFNHGQYSPGTESGQKLLAHELTHVMQQAGGKTIVQKKDTPAEKAAKEEAKKKAALITKIKGYGLSGVEDGGATFTSAELDLVDKAISGLPVKDKTAIKGTKLVRVISLGANTAGQYSNNQVYSGTTSTNEQKIELSNLAFDSKVTSEESIRLVTHEIGHAIADMPHRAAMTDVLAAGVKSNKLTDEANTASDEYNAVNDPYNDAMRESNTAVDTYNEAIKGTDKEAIKSAKTDMDAKKAIVDKLKPKRDAKEKIYNDKDSAAKTQKTVLATKEATAQSKLANIDDLKNDAGTKFTSMKATYTAAGTIINKDDPESKDYRAALTATEEAIIKFYDENVTVDVDEKTANSAKSVVEAAKDDRNTKRADLNKKNPKNTVVAATAALETSQDSCFTAAAIVAFNKSMSLSVKKFYDLVISKNISPGLTKYARDNWPHKPEEFYAEAYSYFVTKPKELEAHSKDLYDWFKAGSYK